MESIIIKEIEMMLELPLHERQKAYFQDLLNDAKTIRKAVLETGYYGEIYKWLYYQSKK